MAKQPELPLLQDLAIRKRVRKAVAAVRSRLDRPLPPTDVHQLRRALKQLRAWCRLLEDTGQPGAKRLKRSLRELAGHYGPARDAQVMAETLAELKEQHGRQFPHCCRMLESAVPLLSLPPPVADCARHRDTLDLLEGLLQSDPPAAAALQQGLARSRRKAEKLCERAWHSLDTEELHELRKAVKLLGNQYALCVNRRGAAGRFHQHLDQLGKHLGRCHDLAVLRAALGAQADTRSKRMQGELEQIDALIDAEEQTLWPECMSLSEDCFPGKVR